MTIIPITEQFNYNRSPARNTGNPQSISGGIDQGYAVSPNYPDKSGFYNGFLGFQDPGQNGQISKVGLFIKDLEFSISLGGTTAQSHNLYQFFAHNLNTPEIVVTCQTRSSFEYSYIAEFIRMTQIYLTSNLENQTSGLVQFYLDPSGGSQDANSTIGKVPREVSVVQLLPPPEVTDDLNYHAQAANGNIVGAHKGMDLQCYITKVSRLAEVGTQMYEFQFNLEYFDVKDSKHSGLPFSTLVADTSPVEGVHWDYEELDLHKGDFIKSSSITITLPHQSTKGSTTPPPATPAPKVSPISGFGGDTSGALLQWIGTLNQNLFH